MASPSASGIAASTAVNTDNHGPIVTVATTFCLVCSLLFLGTRLLWIRWPLRSLGGYDDVSATIGTAVSTLQSIIVLVTVEYGFGRTTVSERNTEIVEKLIYASDIFYIISLCLSKLSVAFLCSRLSSASVQIRWKNYSAVATAVFGFVGVFVVSMRLNLSRPWESDVRDGNSLFVRWLVIEILGLTLEIVHLAFAVFLVWGLQMATRSKVAVASGFAFRLPLIALTALRLLSLHATLSSLTPATFPSKYVPPEIYTQACMHFSLIAATIPCLRIFLKSCTTGWIGEQLPESAFRGQPDTAMATKNSGTKIYGGLSSVGSGMSRGSKKNAASALELADWTGGQRQAKTRSMCMTQSDALGNDAASDGSGRRIVVEQRFDVSYEAM